MSDVKVWEQRGYAIVSRMQSTGMPILHRFLVTEWESNALIESLKKQLPADLTTDLQFVTAVLHYNAPITKSPNET